MDQLSTKLFLFFLTLYLSSSLVISTTFIFVNKCNYTVWPGLLSNAGIAPISTTGFVLQSGDSKSITPPASWGGRFWGRTHCSQDSTGKFTCLTGDCNSGKLECSGNGATPPATLAEFTLDGYGGLDFFDVSLVDGYNVPMLVVPQGGSGDNCTSTGCVGDLLTACPSELRVTSVDGKESVACRSACEAFGSAQYCCSGAYGSPNTCKPSSYSQMFKNACPRAYSYAYDDKTSTFTCASASEYIITFCPPANSKFPRNRGRDKIRNQMAVIHPRSLTTVQWCTLVPMIRVKYHARLVSIYGNPKPFSLSQRLCGSCVTFSSSNHCLLQP
ncbi:variant 2, Thaumatin-like protein 1 [Lathyrus oleraceus]|uniref:Variant 2, Thaumatin-like protein 1 n=1 Tax=Pisum sativum TaxID=3888 RepID=A0A9D4WIH9_PEA|nr:variant 2, Thaumatin-like protein 1 [Pisum sativum]